MNNAFRLFGMVALGMSALCIPTSAATKAQVLQESCQASDRIDTAVAANDSSHLKATDEMGAGFCLRFIEGWEQTINLMAASEAHANLTWFSFPNGFNAAQGKRVFLQYVADHPERLDQPASSILRIALTEKDILKAHFVPIGKECGIEEVPPSKK
jgi:hypothetical protein